MAHIVHICPRYLPARGGAELFFGKISEALSARGHDVSVWTTDATSVRGFTSAAERRFPTGDAQIEGVSVRRFPVRHVPAQRYVRTAAHWLPFGTRWKCDTLRWTPWVPALTRAAATNRAPVALVHASGLPYSSVLFAGTTLAKRAGVPLIISPFTHVGPPGSAGARMRRAYLSALNVDLLSRADRLFVQTEFERRVLQEAGVSSAQTVVGLGVDAGECTGGSRERARRAWRVSDDAVVVGHLANKSWDKGTVDLLDASERLWAAGVRFVLVLAGAEMPSFEQRWSRLRSKEHVIRLGELSDEDRRDFFAAIDVFGLPSYVESFGVSLLEAGLNGAALVAYDHGGPGQIFRDGLTARLASVGSIEQLGRALERLVTDASERSTLGRAARELAATYTWSRALDVALTAYDDLLAGPVRRDGSKYNRAP